MNRRRLLKLSAFAVGSSSILGQLGCGLDYNHPSLQLTRPHDSVAVDVRSPANAALVLHTERDGFASVEWTQNVGVHRVSRAIEV